MLALALLIAAVGGDVAYARIAWMAGCLRLVGGAGRSEAVTAQEALVRGLPVRFESQLPDPRQDSAPWWI